MYLEQFMYQCCDLYKEINASRMEFLCLSDGHWECYFTIHGALNLGFVKVFIGNLFRVIVDQSGCLTLIYERSDIELKEQKQIKITKK